MARHGLKALKCLEKGRRDEPFGKLQIWLGKHDQNAHICDVFCVLASRIYTVRTGCL